ncbi:MAG: cupin domain-containing protein [Alphaproteobacteria bacterium]|nr:cupin domain-containing protein [Alphaproteobacteria bacterium]
MPPPTVNLLCPLPTTGEAEHVEALLLAPGVRLERIVSRGDASPPGFWYDQDEAEWVLVLAGRAGLAIAGEAEERLLVAGDAVFLPAHCRHRVSWTDPERPTVWLALFLPAGASGNPLPPSSVFNG